MADKIRLMMDREIPALSGENIWVVPSVWKGKY
jgi:hypothetical protein